ncbi:glutathione-regulated potassium-efflux system ancillary protein KefC/glutathione-regulated potassium-efflux system protein KefB [Archangium gephyra]|uniref:Glutathione-regulated potassium-efflux system protein KefB n=1 Tax=Archangium gephyra TaxID=48 RepID=A0AAC8QBM0_9BACT|nr:monovalent cation:proton antiporter-2 (CPA2) family protein [Archangium gephyra]AKJ04496.1 Glutathione-regulated potassium-efflux system protein KefB [Archangium gephyra]REG37434.1 glutathione-regulated potassium-efflux system ancillary protein KefC/glutathione-regulated potassium-efflux system protein KefB [Archangium gephyra]
MSILNEVAIFLIAAVIAVPLFKRLGLGSILGYLAAGALIGRSGLKLIREPEHVLHFAEFGVVLFLFIVGLELQPARLWALRRSVFGLGLAQVVLSALVLTGAGMLLGLSMKAALIAGLGLSLSSTAIALQLLGERQQLTARHGRESFAILLFQDLAVIPLLAILPLLSERPEVAGGGGGQGLLLSLLKVVAVLAVVVLSGRFLVRPAFRLIASTQLQELFTAATLLVVVGVALLMNFAGISMALGTFLAGVLLADSEYRHELEADIEPFKGLLLGLFFIAVGMSMNLELVTERPLLIAACVVGVMVLKGGVLFWLGRPMGLMLQGRRIMALALAQGGEFGFVLFGAAATAGVMDSALTEQLVVVVSLSMAATPILLALHDRVVERLLRRSVPAEYDHLEDAEQQPVIIAGFGRYGQIIGRVLNMLDIGFTALEVSPEQVDFLRRYGNKIYYGDASRLDLLRAAGAGKAKLFVLAIDDPDASVRTAQLVRANFPGLPVYARARNRAHAYQLLDEGVKILNRETLLSSLEMAGFVLQGLGFDEERARHIMERFRSYDEQLLQKQYAVYQDEEKLLQTAQQAREELRSLFEQDNRPQTQAQLQEDGADQPHASTPPRSQPPTA